jgi:carbon-monoxide dehydrogenase large subunit
MPRDGQLHTARLALDADHRFTALEIDMVCDMGAYLSAFAPYIPYVGAVMLPGVYDFPACFIRITAAFTNTLPVDAYRGAGRPEAAYLIERLVDVAARLGIAPTRCGARTSSSRGRCPTRRRPTGCTIREFAAHLARPGDDRLEGLSPPRAARSKSHKLRGIGLATYIEACGNGGPDAATVRMGKDGNVTHWRARSRPGRGTRPPMRNSSPSISTCRLNA